MRPAASERPRSPRRSSPLEPFCTACARHIDGIHLNVLRAIALRRKKDAAWRESLCAALDAAREYRFIRTISVYGCAVLPLLEDCQWEKDKRWLKRLTAIAPGGRNAAPKARSFQPRFLSQYEKESAVDG